MNDSRVCRISHSTEGRRTEAGRKRGVIRLIENIERLGAKLHAHRLAKPDVFEKRQIPSFQSRTIDYAASRTTNPILSRRYTSKRSGIKEIFGGSRATRIGITHQIRSAANRCLTAATTNSARVAALGDCKGKSRLVSRDTRNFPTTKQMSGETLLPAEEWYLIYEVNRQDMAPIKLRPPVITAKVCNVLRRRAVGLTIR